MTTLPKAQTDPGKTGDLPSGRAREILLQHGEMIATGVSGLLIATGWFLDHAVSSPAAAFSYVAAFVIGGYAKAKEGFAELIEHKQLNVNMLMIFAAIGSAAIGYWMEGAVLIFIFALSGALETYTMNKSRQEITDLMDLQPKAARLYEDGMERMVPIEQLRVGQTVVVKPGDSVPVDGTIIEGETTIDEAAMTGEAVPVEKKTGDVVLAGTINVRGGVLVHVDKPSGETLFQKMVDLVKSAQSKKPPQQTFVEAFEKHYVLVVLLSVIGVIFLTPVFFSWTWGDAIYRGMVLLVVASPCALVASIMPALLSAISNAARRGVLFKGGAYLQKMDDIKVLAFDKTGTLTMGTPEVREIRTFHGMNKAEIVQMAASIEQLSTHPLAEAIVRKARDMSLPLKRPQGMEAKTGFGVQATLGDRVLWKVGKREYIDAPLDATVEKHAQELAKMGKTVVYVQRGQNVVGLLALEDTVRQEAKHVIAQLKKKRIYTVMLTGDEEETARSIARQTGVDAYYANCLPDEKADFIRGLNETHGDVMMVGDGVNDAPALAVATVGVGMGSGTDVTLDTADIVLMKNDLKKLPYILKLGRRSGKVIKQNIIFSMGVIAALVLANFFQSINLPFGVIGHEGSTILVILNGLRLLIAK